MKTDTMGINNLKSFLRKTVPDAFKSVAMSNFSGRKIAFDGNNIVAQHNSVSRSHIVSGMPIEELSQGTVDKDQVLNMTINGIFNQVNAFLGNGILPVYVFDGGIDDMKTGTCAKRMNDKLKTYAEIDRIKKRFDEFLSRSELEIEANKMCKNLKKFAGLKKSDFDIFRTMFDAIGLPHCTAINDGEKLCSAMCREGLVDAVFSADSDNLPFGANIIIERRTKWKKGEPPSFDCIYLDKVLEGLDLTFEEFIDFCIMCGTDFNKNIRGMGPKMNLKMIKLYGSIDNMSHKTLGCLNHLDVRKQFESVKSANLTDKLPEFKLSPNSDIALQIFRKYDAGSLYYRMLDNRGIPISKPEHANMFNRESVFYSPPKSRYMTKYIIES